MLYSYIHVCDEYLQHYIINREVVLCGLFSYLSKFCQYIFAYPAFLLRCSISWWIYSRICRSNNTAFSEQTCWKNTACPYLHIEVVQYSKSHRLTDPSELQRGEIGNPNAGIIFSRLLSWRVGFLYKQPGDMKMVFQSKLSSRREKKRYMKEKDIREAR